MAKPESPRRLKTRLVPLAQLECWGASGFADQRPQVSPVWGGLEYAASGSNELG
jgi:hypothetical protein